MRKIIMKYEISWWLQDESITELDNMDINHIHLMISHGFSEGELNHGEKGIKGYWKIIK